VYADPEECDLLVVYETLDPAEEEPDPIFHVRFTCRDEWLHVLDDDETYPINTPEDFAEAIGIFRQHHGAYGPLITYYTFDLVDWFRFDGVPGEENNQCTMNFPTDASPGAPDEHGWYE
jgi:hypothetical protein